MTKPNDFILNSDYLALAQTNKGEFTAYFPAASFTPGYAYDTHQDFIVPASEGAIDMCLASLNGAPYKVASMINLSNLYGEQPLYFLTIRIYRVGAKTMRVSLHGFTNYTYGYDMPAQTVRVRFSSFKPPNVF